MTSPDPTEEQRVKDSAHALRLEWIALAHTALDRGLTRKERDRIGAIDAEITPAGKAALESD